VLTGDTLQLLACRVAFIAASNLVIALISPFFVDKRQLATFPTPSRWRTHGSDWLLSGDDGLVVPGMSLCGD